MMYINVEQEKVIFSYIFDCYTFIYGLHELLDFKGYIRSFPFILIGSLFSCRHERFAFHHFFTHFRDDASTYGYLSSISGRKSSWSLIVTNTRYSHSTHTETFYGIRTAFGSSGSHRPHTSLASI